MIRFLLKGLFRDKSRSRLPVIVVAIGVTLSVFVHAYVTGIMNDMIEQTARFSGGHVKVMTKAYADEADQIPNDLAITEISELNKKLQETFPEIEWATRIKFGGLIDVPDSSGETKTQGPAIGIGLDILSPDTKEIDRLNLQSSLVRGSLPTENGQVLLSEDFSNKLAINPGERITLIGTTMNGGMAFQNFIMAGTVRFGNTAMDRGTIIANLKDVQEALDMNDAAGEILGFLPQGYYHDNFADPVIEKFSQEFNEPDNEFAPAMFRLRDTESMALYIDLAGSMSTIVTFVFLVAMSLVLWNAGLLGGLRRYGEIGIRLAIGEEKRHIYLTMLFEAVMVGIAGTIIGTAFGLFFAWLLQEYGLDISEFTQNTVSSVMIPNEVHARITPSDYYIGFVPGVISTLIGAMLAGIGIYKRKTAQLFKELEA